MPDLDSDGWFVSVLLVLPGFLSLALIRYLAGLAGVSEFEFFAYSLSLSLLIFFVATILHRGVTSLKNRLLHHKRPAGAHQLPRPSVSFLGVVLLIAICFGIAGAYFYEKDTLVRIVRSAPLTGMTTKRSSARPLVFLFSLNRQGRLEEGRPSSEKAREAWVMVKLDSGTTFSGYPEFFPFGHNESEIFLSPACTHSDTVSRLAGPGVLIREANIETITFLDKLSSDCHNLWSAVKRAGEGLDQGE